MKPRKAARTGNSKGITSSARNPLDKLPIYKRNYVQARASGASVKEASEVAGVSGRQGSKYESQADIQAAYRQLMQKAVPAKKLVSLIKAGCEAKTPVYGPDGKKRGERADWKTRKGYIEMAAKHGGYYEEKNVAATSGITVVVNHIGQTTPNANIKRPAEITAKADGTPKLM